MEYRNYEIWHDEYRGDDKVNEYWHGILFVPSDKKTEINNLIKLIRREHNFKIEQNIKFAGVFKTGQKKKDYILNILQLFRHVLIVREDKASSIFFHRTGKDIYEKKFKPFLKVNGIFGCKFALLKIPDNHISFNYFSEYAKKVETTFRFIFKNACHSFFDEKNPIIIKKIYFDGNEHHGRNYDLIRMIPKDMRLYCKISDKIVVDDRSIKDRNDVTMLLSNFTDNIVGGLTAKINNTYDPKILYSINDLYDRVSKDEVFKLKNSKWYKSIICSECSIHEGKLEFPNIFRDPNQIHLL